MIIFDKLRLALVKSTKGNKDDADDNEHGDDIKVKIPTYKHFVQKK